MKRGTTKSPQSLIKFICSLTRCQEASPQKISAKNSWDPTRSKQLSTVAILDFQFGLYHVIAPLSFLLGISLVSLFTHF